MKIVYGDLIKLALAGEFDVIVHGCNCQCMMGKGIALSIKKIFPEAYRADCATPKGDKSKLGSISFAKVLHGERDLIVVNAYTQFHWRGAGVKADYDSIQKAMKEVKVNFSGKRIAYPKIGAGLAGGDWQTIRLIIEQELFGEDHTYVEYV